MSFALAPSIRYTARGLRGVDPALIEAGKAMVCTPRQIRTCLHLAMPEIRLGLNRTILFALSMPVTSALVGTRDRGQEVDLALTKADAGRWFVAGLCVAFIAIIADRLIHAAASRSCARLGLSDGDVHDPA